MINRAMGSNPQLVNSGSNWNVECLPLTRHLLVYIAVCTESDYDVRSCIIDVA